MRRRVITVFNQRKVHGSTGLPSPLRIHNLPKVDAQRAESTWMVRLCTVQYNCSAHTFSHVPYYTIRSHWPILFVRVCQCACHTPFRISNLDSLYSGVVSNRQRRVPSVRALAVQWRDLHTRYSLSQLQRAPKVNNTSLSAWLPRQKNQSQPDVRRTKRAIAERPLNAAPVTCTETKYCSLLLMGNANPRFPIPSAVADPIPLSTQSHTLFIRHDRNAGTAQSR